MFPSLRGYRASWLAPDLRAAVMVLAIAIPEQLATSRLAGMPPVTGYYAFIAGGVMFALLGANPLLSAGADSTIAPLFAAGIAHFAPLGSAGYVDRVGVLAVMTGAIVMLVGLFRLGWIAEFLSTPIITGFLAGVAVIIVIHQLPDLLAIPGGSGSDLQRLSEIATHVAHLNGWSLGIGLGVLATVVAAERVDRRIPGAFLGLALSAATVAGFSLAGHGVPVLGTFAHGAPRFGLRGLSFAEIGGLAPLAAVVALVVVSQTAVTSRAFPGGSSTRLDVGRDFVGVGAGSILAGFVGSFALDASPPRTAAAESVGGRSQMSGLLAAGALALMIPVAGVLRDVPLAALSAVLIFVALRLFHLRDLIRIARFSLFEIALALVTLLTVALVGVEQGVGLAVTLAIVERARLSARPQLHVLGRLPGTTSWVPLSRRRGAEQVPGVLVTLFASPLWYANVRHFEAEMLRSIDGAEGSLRVVVLDAIGMSDIDFTGARTLEGVLDELARRRVGFAMARVGERVVLGLERAGLLDRIGRDRVFASAQLAVSAMEAEPTGPDPTGPDPTGPDPTGADGGIERRG